MLDTSTEEGDMNPVPAAESPSAAGTPATSTPGPAASSSREPVCGSCGTKESTIWHKTDPDDPLNAPLCSSCHTHSSPVLSGAAAGPAAGVPPLRAGPSSADGESSQEPHSPPPSSVVDLIRAETFSDLMGRRSRDRTPELGQLIQSQSKALKDIAAKGSTPARKTTRSRGKQLSAKFTSTKGRSRRIVFKNRPLKGPTSFATLVTSDCLFHRGAYLQVGDIVQIIDEEDELPYYGQIRGFLQDQYCNKSAAINWLLPLSEEAAVDRWTFHPAHYYLGPAEEFPRTLDCMEFVMHAPSDYYRPAAAPYQISRPASTTSPAITGSGVGGAAAGATVPQTPIEQAVDRHMIKSGRGCVWTSLGPRVMTRSEWESHDWELLPSHPLPSASADPQSGP